MRSVGFKTLVAVFVAFLVPVYWIAFNAPAVGVYHDDGVYLVTAKALAEGKGYRIISLPQEIPQTKYPILFPGVLSVAWKIFPGFPDNALFLKLVPFLSAALWLWLSFLLVREETGVPDAALWIVLLTAASSWVVFFSTTFMSETFFSCLVTGALIRLKRLEGQGGDAGMGGNLLIASALVAASVLTRTIGASLMVAGAFYFVIKRKYLVGGIYLVICSLLIAPWLLWQFRHSDSSLSVYSYYTMSNYTSWNALGNLYEKQILRVVSVNILSILYSPMVFFNLNGKAIGLFISIVMSSLTCIGFIRNIRVKINSLHVFLIVYISVIIIWAWPPHRFILPTIPLLLLFAYKELSRICGRIFSSWATQKYCSAIIVVLLGIITINGLVLRTGETLKRQAVSSFLPSMYEPYDWNVMKEIFDWIRLNTPENSILLGNLDPMYYLYTGRKAVRGFSEDSYKTYYAKNPDTPLDAVPILMQRIASNRVNYLIRTPSSYFKDAEVFNGTLDRLLSDYPQAFHVVRVCSDSSSMIYEVDQGKLRQALP